MDTGHRIALCKLLGVVVASALAAGCAEIRGRIGVQEDDQDPRYDNFIEDFPRVRAEHRDRPTHKALAYGLLGPRTGPFVAGWGYDQGSQDEAVARALDECRQRMNRQPASKRHECVLYSVDGRVVSD